MNWKFEFAVGATALALSTLASAQITFYEGEAFRGRTFATNKAVENFSRVGFNDLASSVVVQRGSWEVCEDSGFHGHCTVLRQGSYDSLRSLGLDNRISSVRAVDGRRAYDNEIAPAMAAPNYDWRRRPDERVFDAPVTSVHAVVGPPEQRCWMEREQVQQRREEPNVGGAIAGALLGGILGHQVGGGMGKDIATAGGAVAGGVIGSRVGRDGTTERDVRRCENVAAGPPQYWDVTYRWRGTEHRVQMTSAPGSTIPVNRNGEPRG